ncbi:hypothetical protein [Sphingobium yanoikuyae]|uniref:hypothetical protein n=1 Tax=Sphingobium yanoikuyae TaxID=13690 RepID=UPI0028A80DE3|nr:hypothetical protein [Sphingobium yanoikuyae]
MDKWDDATFYTYSGVQYPVCYRHLIRAIPDGPTPTSYFSYRLNPRDEDSEAAHEWAKEFVYWAKRAGAVILASLNSHMGNVATVDDISDRHDRLYLRLLHTDRVDIPMPPRPEPKRGEFYPRAFMTPDDAWANFVLKELGPTHAEVQERMAEERRLAAIERRRG